MIRAAGLTLAALLCISAAEPQSELERFFALRKDAAVAMQAGDLPKAEAALEGALAINPASPGSLIQLARVETVAGKPDEAIAHLRTYAELGLTIDVGADKALSTLVGQPGFVTVAARLKANAQPVGEIRPLWAIPAKGDVVEGLVTRGGGWLVSSITGRKILSSSGEPYPTSGGPIGPVFGMATQIGDYSHVWVTEAEGPTIPGSGKPHSTALLQIDFMSGALRARYPAPDDGVPRQFGDVAVTQTGDVVVSDSLGRRLYRLRKGGTALELLLDSPELGSPQGLATCGDDALLIADYSTALHRLDLSTGKLERVGGKMVALAGTDGLLRIEDWKRQGRWERTYVVTQNGVSPSRILQLRLSADCRRIEAVETLAANRPELADITLAVQLADGVAFIGGSGWAMVDAQGKLDPTATINQPRLYHVDLR